jgi:hypothetical protein
MMMMIIIIIISPCQILAKEQYIKRYVRVRAQLHFNIYKEMRVKLDKRQWYDHVNGSLPGILCGYLKNFAK